MNRPRVTAQYHIESIERRTWSGACSIAPEVEVSVVFDLHDHKFALDLLDAAVAEVRAQIEETKEGSQ